MSCSGGEVKSKRAYSTSPTVTASSDGEASERDALLRQDELLIDVLLGVAFLVIVALIWTFASLLVQYILDCRLVTVKAFSSALSSHRSGLSPTSHTTSLNLTSVSGSTIFFTFLLSVVALKEPFVWMKLAGVIFCMEGNISTIFNDKGPGIVGTDHVVGDLWHFLPHSCMACIRLQSGV
ncbi:hypothetical protein PsorP6_009675 [Peronosclerospora sorghi]|uniref:Uncharacterized protein n=1 Tax=Peronosclerospora sorghi TaxID=230839 RepID=A0ACC0VZ99_9STRA|nr:hypothetical protein PsorP6_009675 [Peronosclerospora sorghi]